MARDALRIWQKIRYVLVPKKMIAERAEELRNWDLWGPLLLCILLALTLSISKKVSEDSYVFETVFMIVWLGAGLISINGMLLGG